MIRETLEGLNELADDLAHETNVLDHWAKASDAESAKAENGGDTVGSAEHRSKAQRQRQARDKKLRFLGVVRNAITALKPRAKRAGFQPPTEQEALAYAQTIGLPAGAVSEFFDHYKRNGWRVGKSGHRMMDWQAALRLWKRNSEKDKPKAVTTEDPKGWREFLSNKGMTYREYRYAAEFLRIDFLKGKRK
jgi:hypothetical protein